MTDALPDIGWRRGHRGRVQHYYRDEYSTAICGAEIEAYIFPDGGYRRCPRCEAILLRDSREEGS